MGYFESTFPIVDCIKDAEIIVQDIEKGAYYLKQGINIKDVTAALKAFGDALTKLPHTISECKNCAGIISEVKKMAIVFSNPAVFLLDVAKNIFWHHKDITNDIHNARTAWDNKQYFNFGKFIGELIHTATKLRKVQGVQGVKEVSQVIEGVMFGMFGQDYKIEECLQDGEIIWEDITKAAFYIKAGKLSDIGEAFKYVGDAFGKLPNALSECKDAEGIIQEFAKVKDIFKSPFKFLTESGLRILWHFRDITKDISSAKENWNNKNYLEFGRFIGLIGKIAFGGDKLEAAIPQMNADNLLTFLHHFWWSAFGLDLQVAVCDAEGHKAVEIVNEIIELYNLGMFNQALTFAMAKYPEIVGLFSHCRSGAKEFMEGINELTFLQSPGHASEAIQNAMKHHIISFPKDVMIAKQALEDGDFAKLGDALGELTDFVLEEC